MKRSAHNLSHHVLSTFDQGYIVPIGLQEVLMGDTFVHSSRALLRLATLVAPVMHQIDVSIHHWFVPNRIVFPEWDELITGQNDALTVPTVTVNSGSVAGSLLDYYGVPDGVNQTVNELPIRGYNKIFNEFYRDQDLVSARAEDAVSLAAAMWGKDYFTTCRADPQKGSAVSIPFEAGLTAPVTGIAVTKDAAQSAPAAGIHETDNLSVSYSFAYRSDNSSQVFFKTPSDGGPPEIRADLASASGGGIDINEFRLAMAMQRHLEARNRFGSRIQDYYAFHGIKAADARLDLPQYCGGGRSLVSVSEVLATAEGTNTDVGDQAGHGICSVTSRRYGAFFTESGYVHSFMIVRPRTMYMQQLHRHWLRSNKWDYWQKEMELLGPQAVYVKEVYGVHGNATDVFGYNGRHDEYRRNLSYVTGGFRGSTYDDWHLARSFGSAPTLNGTFVTADPTNRPYADTSEPECKVMVVHDLKAKRLVSFAPKH